MSTQPLSIAQFGQLIKSKHPEYGDMSDVDVGQRTLAKYPEYSDMVNISPEMRENLARNVGPTQFERERQSTPSLLTNPREFLNQRAEQMGQAAQSEVNKVSGPESAGRGVLNRAGHAFLSYVPATAQVIDKAASGLMDWKNAAAVAAGAVDPAIPAAYFGAQGIVGTAQGVNDIARNGANPENVQNTLLNASTAVSGAAGGGQLAGRALDLSKRIAKSPIADVMNKARGTVPAETATPAELKAYADQNNIPINAAQATEHNFPRNLQSVGERATVGGTAVKRQTEAAQAAVVQHAQNLMDQFSPNTPDVATAGQTIKANVQTALERELAASRQEYAAVDQAAQQGAQNGGMAPGGGAIVDLKPLKQQAQSLLNQSSFLRSTNPLLDAKRAAAILENTKNYPDKVTFQQAQDIRSGLLDEANHPENVINEKAQAWIKQLTGQTDSAMMRAAQTQPGLGPLFRSANEHWKMLQEDFNSARSPLYQILREPDPSKVPQKLTQQGQIGGSPYNAGLLDKYGIDKGPVKWSITGDMLKKDFGLYNGRKNLAGYSDEFLRSVFTPDELSQIYKTGAIARSARLNTNTSGTAAVEGAMADVQRPVRSLLPKWFAAKATNSPAFNDWLMRNPPPPASNIAATARWRFMARKAMALAAGSNAAVQNSQQPNPSQ